MSCTHYEFFAFPPSAWKGHDGKPRSDPWSTCSFSTLKETQAYLKKCKEHLPEWERYVKPMSSIEWRKGYTIYKVTTEEVES